MSFDWPFIDNESADNSFDSGYGSSVFDPGEKRARGLQLPKRTFPELRSPEIMLYEDEGYTPSKSPGGLEAEGLQRPEEEKMGFQVRPVAEALRSSDITSPQVGNIKKKIAYSAINVDNVHSGKEALTYTNKGTHTVALLEDPRREKLLRSEDGEALNQVSKRGRSSRLKKKKKNSPEEARQEYRENL